VFHAPLVAAERCINKIKVWRGLAMRSDKTPESYLAGLQLRGSIIGLRAAWIFSSRSRCR
jgi:transposase